MGPVAANRAVSVIEMMRNLGITELLACDITEFAVNRPNEFWTKSGGLWQRFDAPDADFQRLTALCTAIAVFNKKPLDRDHPIASLQLPGGERCQIVLPPATIDGQISITIRKPSSARFTLAEYAGSGRLQPRLALSDTDNGDDTRLLKLAQSGQFEVFFTEAVIQRRNIVTVGGTGSGKTTFSKALLDLYPAYLRLITIEDAHELTTPLHPNVIHLIFGPNVSAKDLVAATLRMDPDNIFLTELRGDETWDYLMALKSGHPGSITSVHANDCLGALAKLASYIKQSPVGQSLSYEHIMREVESTIDIVCYFENTHLKEVYFNPEKKRQLLKGSL